MKIRLNEKQLDLLRRLSQDTDFEKEVALFPIASEFELDDDLADDLGELCVEREIFMAQSRAEGDMSKDEDGELAVELVDLLFMG